ncbi:MAG: M36 family metallopeptidase [Xanthomonadales bacterium]|nr:M36 family metallopeptidase [Xanthomonadales bacterium]
MAQSQPSRRPRGPYRVLAASFALTVAAAAQAASYRVYPLPIASPDHGPRALVTDPHHIQASPFGWHDTNGVPGAEFTILRGNNVWVYLDQDNDNLPDGPGPDGGPALVFDYPAAPGVLPPLSYADALATNAFYLGNMIHDILWQHGFREADGNFQENNYGNGGLGGDAMRIEIFNGGGTNNANSTSTVDGVPPRIQLYVWTMTNPHREGSFDAGVLAWAYMQSVQRRLGGLACFGNSENPTFGYSDFVGTLITNDFSATNPATPRGVGTWLMGSRSRDRASGAIPTRWT